MIRHRLGFTDKLAIIPERSMAPKVSFLVSFVSVVLATIMLTVFVFGPGLENYASHTQPYGTIRLANPIDEPEIDPGERTSSSDFTEGAEIIIPSDGTTEEESQDKGQPKNILFIIVDDLRPQLGAYHDPEHPDHFGKVRMYTPNLDKLASQSILFTHAYAQYSLCGPSRASLLTSRRPDVTRVFGNEEYWRNVGGNFTTLPQHFKNNGYFTVGMGKVFHPRSSSNNDDPPSWTTPYYHSIHRDGYFLPKDSVGGWFSVPKSEIDKIPLVDMVSTEMAKVILTDMSLTTTTTTTTTTTKRPFFMAVGFNKPHLSMVCPEEFYDKYPLEEEERFLVNTSWHKPLVRPSVNIDGIQTEADERILPPDALRDLRRAYFACISYVDDLVGQILRKLEETGLDKGTIVSFMADHGFHLGENRHWGKVTTWELSNRVPMMIRIPGLTDAGIVSPSVVESVDMFPTLVEAAGLEPLPVCPKRSGSVPLCTQGISLMPLLRKPKERVQSAAFSQIVATDGMRYTIRTGRHRLVETALVYNVSQPNGSYQISVEWQSTMDRIELYDHEMDILEQVNLINDRRYADVVEDLRERLHEFVESLIG